MARKLTSRLNRSNNLWWITGGTAILALCAVGAFALYSSFPGAPTALPTQNEFQLTTSTPTPPGFATVTSFPTSTSSLPGVTPAATITPLSTPTNSSIFNWIFQNFTARNSQNTTVPVRTSTPIQVGVVTPTRTVTVLAPPPAQGSPNPVVCKNILYPARPGNQWTYFVNTPKRSGDVNIRVAAVEGAQAAIDATEVNVGSTVRSFMTCEQD